MDSRARPPLALIASCGFPGSTVLSGNKGGRFLGTSTEESSSSSEITSSPFILYFQSSRPQAKCDPSKGLAPLRQGLDLLKYLLQWFFTVCDAAVIPHKDRFDRISHLLVVMMPVVIVGSETVKSHIVFKKIKLKGQEHEGMLFIS